MRQQTSRYLSNVLLAFLLISAASCMDGAESLDNRQGSSNPFAAQIIVVDGNPDIIFGNLSDEVQIQIKVNRNVTPDGTIVTAELNSFNLPVDHRGCVLGGSTFTSNGEAFLNILSGLFIDQSGMAGTATVNIGVTLTRATGQSESRSFALQLNPVFFTAPADTEIETNQADDPTFRFLTLEFLTQGIPVGTIAEFEVSNPAIGDVENSMVPVQGDITSGRAIVQYNTVNNTGGTQIITGTIILPDPPTMDPSCNSIPVGQRTLFADVVITQSVPPPPSE